MSFIMNVDRVGKSGNTHNVRVFFYDSNPCCLEWWVSIYVGHLEKNCKLSKDLVSCHDLYNNVWARQKHEWEKWYL